MTKPEPSELTWRGLIVTAAALAMMMFEEIFEKTSPWASRAAGGQRGDMWVDLLRRRNVDHCVDDLLGNIRDVGWSAQPRRGQRRRCRGDGNGGGQEQPELRRLWRPRPDVPAERRSLSVTSAASRDAAHTAAHLAGSPAKVKMAKHKIARHGCQRSQSWLMNINAPATRGAHDRNCQSCHKKTDWGGIATRVQPRTNHT